jgi:hypothetical protein
LQYWKEAHPDPTPDSTPKYNWHTSLVDDFHANMHVQANECCDATEMEEEKKEEDSKEKKEEDDDEEMSDKEKSSSSSKESVVEVKKKDTMEIHVHVHLDQQKKKRKRSEGDDDLLLASEDAEDEEEEEAREMIDEFCVGVEPHRRRQNHKNVPYKTRLQWEHYFLMACDRSGLTQEQKEQLFSDVMDVRHWNVV